MDENNKKRFLHFRMPRCQGTSSTSRNNNKPYHNWKEVGNCLNGLHHGTFARDELGINIIQAFNCSRDPDGINGYVRIEVVIVGLYKTVNQHIKAFLQMGTEAGCLVA